MKRSRDFMIPGWGLIVAALVVLGLFPRLRAAIDRWDAPRVELRAGQALVARPGVLQDRFAETVVLLVRWEDDGRLGIVLNRPAEGTGWFDGGPVRPEARWLLVKSDAPPRDGVPLLPELYLVPSASHWPDGAEIVREFRGYAGWARGQLEGEIAYGAWFVTAIDASDALSPDPEGLWPEMIGRHLRAVYQPGRRSGVR